MGCAEVLKQEKTAGVQYIPELGKSMEVTFNYITSFALCIKKDCYSSS